jgi:hypothetical protein
MVSTILECSPPWFRPVYRPSTRSLTWPNGSVGLCLSAEDPEQARGPNADLVWADELGAWGKATETWRNVTLALRKGDTRAFVSTTPRRIPALVDILAQPTTVVATENTLANRLHLSEEFVDQILALYKGTRFEQQEVHGRMLDQPEGAWFATSFNERVHVTQTAEYDWQRSVVIGLDVGTSRTSGAVYLQARKLDKHRMMFTCFGDYLAIDRFSGDNARAIADRLRELAPRCDVAQAWIDPASAARTSIGPTAKGEYELIFKHTLQSAPSWHVCDGLDMITGLLERGDLLIHPRCTALIAGIKNYMRAKVSGQFLDVPAGNQPPHEDMLDALRYGIVGSWPEGRKPQPNFARVPAHMVV